MGSLVYARRCHKRDENIITPQMMVAKGVIFEGTSKMEEAIRSHSASTGAAPGKVTLLKDKDDK